MSGFRCRVPYNSDMAKIRTFLEDTDSINIVAGKCGIAFVSMPKGEECYYIAAIHSPDIHRLRVCAEWDTGIVRVIPSSYIINFLKGREANADIQFQIDIEGTTLNMSIMSGKSIIRSRDVPLLVSDMIYEYPTLTDANIVIVVNEFKKFCSTMAKESSEIRIEAQSEGIRFAADESDPCTYGDFDESEKPDISYVKSTAFSKASKINIGNTKSAYASVTIKGEYPMLVRLKLGMVEFKIYSKRYMT